MAVSYLTLATDGSHANPYAAEALDARSAQNALSAQKRAEAEKEREYKNNWWKRGLAKGAMGAVQGGLTGLLSGGLGGAAAGAGAGLAGGFGGEALNHAAFNDENESLGNTGASLGALAGSGLGKYIGGGATSSIASGITGQADTLKKALAAGEIDQETFQDAMAALTSGGRYR